MTKRIFRSIFIVASLVLLACLVIIMGVLYDYLTAMQRDTLAVQTSLAAHGVENEGQAYFDGLQTEHYRYTWVDATGQVLYDSQADPDTMDNHLDRQEIAEAFVNGSGESQRLSSTLAEKTFYRAVLLKDGTVLRVSMRQYTMLTLSMGMAQPICMVLVIAIALSAWLASRLSRRIVTPLNELDLDSPLENDAYDELSPLLNRIERQHRQIAEQMDILRRRQDEFIAVTNSMSEGLILLNAHGYILSINKAAMSIFGADGSCTGQDILTLDRSAAMRKLVSEALAGQHAEAIIQPGDIEYQLDASPILSEGVISGACLLAFDITEKALAERRRREFSANVSHELKTPLHSIMGAAELMENGLMKPEDMPRFAGRIRSEAGRLVTLIDDIIRLSRLDEGDEPPAENVDLYQVAEEAVSALQEMAEERGVTLRLRGESAAVWGQRRLCYEIAYNLCDNAIKYNKPGGSVDMEVYADKNEVRLVVTDTGLGIPKEAQSRVFERFYRVDKSHSKETGGTGLGLSIVKHAAHYMGAGLHLESESGQGTRMTVSFPANN